MTFDSIDALKNYILSRSEIAIKNAQLEIHAIIDRFLMQYYSEYDPSLYERTYQLLHSLVKSDVKSTGNGWTAEVYFDVSMLDYSVKTLKGIGTWANKNWSEQTTLENAMTGALPHGGYASGTPIWTESMNIIDAKAIEILKKHLIAAGISLK